MAGALKNAIIIKNMKKNHDRSNCDTFGPNMDYIMILLKLKPYHVATKTLIQMYHDD